MSSQTPQLPPKPEVALALLQSAPSLYIHLDPRPEDVSVPVWFKKQPQLVLQVGLNMTVPIVDLDVGDEGISCTLSFNRRAEFCRIPWSAIFGLVGEDGRGMIWPESVPAEVAASAEGRAPLPPQAKTKKPRLRLASVEEETGEDEAVAAEVKVSPEVQASDSEEQGSDALAVTSSEQVETSSEEVEPSAEAGGGEDKVAKKSSGRPSYLRLVK